MKTQNLLYVILAIAVLAAAIFLKIVPQVSSIQGNITQMKIKEETVEQEKLAVKAAEKKYKDWQKRKAEEKKQAELNNGKCKAIYEPKFIPSYIKDDSPLFGKMLQDIVNIAKKNGLKVRSLEFFSNVKNEPLLSGASATTIEQELANIKSNKDQGANNASQSQETPSNAPASATGYKGYQVDFGFIGSYSGLNKFISEVVNYKYLIKIRKVETLPYTKNPSILISNVSLVLFIKKD